MPFQDESFPNYDYLVVGSGLYGLTIANKIATVLQKSVLIVEKRTHIGGNAYSYFDETTNIEVHKYGSHLFHTSNEEVWNFVSQFTKFNNYRHKVKTIAHGKVYSLPINLHTINQFLGKTLSPVEASEWLTKVSKEFESNEKDFETFALKSMGKELYSLFIKNYTQKQWQTDPKLLPDSIISRLPIRLDYNDDYFDDKYQGLPMNGYGDFLEAIIKHPNIHIRTGIDFFQIRNEIPKEVKIIYTGPIDQFYDYRFGMLAWRTLDFELEVLDIADFQGTSVMNYADLEPKFTRIHEFKHLHPERKYQSKQTLVMREYSRFAGKTDEPYYPVNGSEDRAKLSHYRELASKEANIIFGGRLGRYQYLDMHMAILSAIRAFEIEFKEMGW